MGGSESFDYLAPSGSGENTLVTCENGDYAADLEIAHGVPRAPEFPEPLDAPDGGRDAGHAHVRGARGAALDRPRRDVEGDAGGARRRHARARAPARRRPARGGEAAVARSEPISVRRPTRRSSRASAPRAAPSVPSGFSGPVVADETLREGQFVAGANRTGWHLRGVEAGRDYRARVRGHPPAEGGRRLPDLRRHGSASRRRSRSVTSSSSAPRTRSPSAPSTRTRTGSRSRS